MTVGMNPSGKKDEVRSYPFVELKDGFWAPIDKMLGKYKAKSSYIDLLPVRGGRQDQVYIDSIQKNEYFGKLISHTRDYIEEVSPKLIIFANTSKFYWGFGRSHGWMGYKFKRVGSPLCESKQCWKLYRIEGIVPNDVNRHSSATNLEGHLLLLYRQHSDARGNIVPQEKELTENDIECLAKYIDADWEATLF